MTQNLTIAITTYRRPEMLTHCLDSLLSQTQLPQNIIIIDNDPKFSAKSIVQNYQNKLPLTYLNEKKKGTPYARNCALTNCHTSYLAFIDDDCVVNKNWYSRASLYIKTHKFNYITGQSQLLNKSNLCAQGQFYNQQTWFKDELQKTPFSPFLFDTKNIVINMDVIHKYKLKFNAIYSNFNFSGFEDTDMGFQFAKHGLYGTYNSNLIIYHQEPSQFLNSIKKAYYRGCLKKNFDQKWHIQTIPTPFVYHLKKLIASKSLVTLIAEIYQLSFSFGYLHHK